MKPKLKACPWCGVQPRLRESTVTKSFIVECMNHECHVVAIATHYTLSGSVDYWNTRRKARKGKGKK